MTRHSLTFEAHGHLPSIVAQWERVGVGIWEEVAEERGWIKAVAVLDVATRKVSRAKAGGDYDARPLDVCTPADAEWDVVDPEANPIEITRAGEPFASVPNDWFDRITVAEACTGDTIVVEAYGQGTTGWGNSLVLLGADGKMVRDLGSMDGDLDFEDYTSPRPRWTPDEKFLLYPKPGGSWVFDPVTATGAPWVVESTSATRPWPIRK